MLLLKTQTKREWEELKRFRLLYYYVLFVYFVFLLCSRYFSPLFLLSKRFITHSFLIQHPFSGLRLIYARAAKSIKKLDWTSSEKTASLYYFMVSDGLDELLRIRFVCGKLKKYTQKERHDS